MSEIVKAYIDGDILVHRCSAGQTFNGFKRKAEDLVCMSLYEVGSNDYKIAIKGDNNFRKTIDPTYKGTRKVPDPEVLDLMEKCYDWLEEQGAVRATGMEADDLLAIWQTEEPGIILSVDKDMLQVPGHHFNVGTWKYHYITEDVAEYKLLHQVMTGDSVDNIKGLPGIGPVKASKCLEGLTQGNRLSAVKKLWQQEYGRGWEDNMQMNMDLVYLRRTMEDRYTI